MTRSWQSAAMAQRNPLSARHIQQVFREYINERIEELRITPTAFARRIGVSQSTISKIINNKGSNVSWTTVSRLCYRLGPTVPELFSELAHRCQRVINEAIERGDKLQFLDLPPTSKGRGLVHASIAKGVYKAEEKDAIKRAGGADDRDDPEPDHKLPESPSERNQHLLLPSKRKPPK